MNDLAFAPALWPRRLRDLRALHACAIAAALACLALALGWRGSDLPAQVFRVELFRRYGFVLWNSQWFGGHPTLDYSVLSPALGALVGPVVLGALSGVVAAVLFDRLVERAFGRVSRLGSLWFAMSTVTNLLVGRVTFALGVALGLGAVLALQRRRAAIGVACAILASLASPLAGLFVAIVAAAWAAGDRARRVAATAITVGALVPIVVIAAVFPGGGSFPYESWAFVCDLLVCASFVLFVPRRFGSLRWGVAAYAVVIVGAFVVSSPLGGNVSRMGQYLVGPLLACVLLPTRRVVLALLALPFLFWQWFPAVDAMALAHGDPATRRAYYQPLVDYLESRPRSYGRVEVPSTFRHWEAAYVAPTVPLARGWERQLDISYNKVFYDGTLNVDTYAQWLTDNGVEYVALPDARLDDSSAAEKQLIVGHPPYLRPAWSNAHWQVWRFTGYRGLVDGPARLVSISPDRFTLDVAAPGDVLVRVHASGHWKVGSDIGCVSSTPDGWTLLRDLPAGTVTVTQALVGTGCGARP